MEREATHIHVWSLIKRLLWSDISLIEDPTLISEDVWRILCVCVCVCVCVDQCCKNQLSNHWMQALNWKVIRRFHLLGCTAVQSSGIVATVRRIMPPPSSTWRWKQNVSASWPRRWQSSQFRPVELQNWHMFSIGLLYCEVGVVTRLLAGRPVNRGSIPGSDKWFVSASKIPDLPWSPPSFLFNGLLFVFGATAPSGPGPPHSWGF